MIRAIRLPNSDRFRDLYAGLLCTVDVANDPLGARSVPDGYSALPRIYFLPPRSYLGIIPRPASWRRTLPMHSG